MKKIFIIIFCCIFLYSCSHAAKGVAKIFDSTSFDNIIVSVKKFFDDLFPGNIKSSKTESDNIISEVDIDYTNPNLYIQSNKILYRYIKNKCDENKEMCDEIASWETPKELADIQNYEPTYEEKIANQLNCVAIVVSENYEKIGTGFFYKKNRVITNNHVMEDGSFKAYVITFRQYVEDLEAITNDENHESGWFSAYVSQSDPYDDLVTLNTDGNNFTTCRIADESPNILSEVIAIGHPNELFYTITKGDINAYRDRNYNFIDNKNSLEIFSTHTDTPIFKGNSGGPLFYNGKVIGINTFGLGESLNFSIHFNIFKKYLL